MAAGVVCLALCLVGLLPSAHGYFVNVDAHAEECFFDRVSTGMKMGLTFEVVEGGFLDIDVRIVGPDDKTIYSGERESSGKYTFAAHLDGVYQYCFGNQMSSMTPKTVMFSMDVGEAPKDKAEGEGDNTQLDKMVSDLSMGLSVMKHEQEYMEVRERLHRMINDNTNSRVVWWSIFESVLLILMTIGQIYYLKRFFEVKRVI